MQKRTTKDTKAARRALLAVLLALSVLAGAAQAQFRDEDPGKPAILQGVGLTQKLNWQVPADATFRDESGKTVQMGQYYGSRPVVLMLVYYRCPMLCTEVLNGITSALRAVSFNPGKEFDVVAISIDPRETPQLAAEKKALYLKSYNRAGSEAGWHFLTGEKEQIDVVAQAVGFRYRYDAQNDQYVHAAGVMVLTPQGRIARYFYGVEYAPKDLRLALVESSTNKIGNAVDAVLLFCYHYDAQQGRYTPMIMNIVRGAGALTLLALGMFVGLMFRNEKKKTRGQAA